ncbi:alpha/beta fold hydrolase [Planobispora siamensis]|uniref:Ndr family protein n=1 Tax=Planobispora siamensis TaxID=936338 RepID=A0A8J3SQJ7_9ACTN|nr:alpha/beta hydrolase [Planobispora siamensis]GIH97077.1 Ndr family protein [Planobispora siamensis]
MKDDAIPPDAIPPDGPPSGGTSSGSARPGAASIYTSPQGARAVEQVYRRLLKEWPVPGEQLLVPTREGETFVLACGPQQAPPVVLLHGSGANTAMWAAQAQAWSPHLRLYAVDIIGEPGLSAPSRPATGSEAYALWLDDVLAGLGLEKTSIVGVSLGGWIALDYAVRRPGRVERLALLCPAGIGRQKWGVVLLALLLMPFGRRGRRLVMRKALGVSGSDAAQSARERAFGEYVMLIHRSFRPRREKLPVFGDAALRGITAPMLVIVGGRDGLLDSHQTRRRLERAAPPRVSVRLLPEAGHLLRGQEPEILEFLRAEHPAEGADGPGAQAAGAAPGS